MARKIRCPRPAALTADLTALPPVPIVAATERSSWAYSSVGQSGRLITGWSLVRAQVGPPFPNQRHPMNPQIAALHQLQKQDRQLGRLERKLDLIPRRIKELDEDLDKLRAMLDAEREKCDQTRQFQRSQQLQLEDEVAGGSDGDAPPPPAEPPIATA